MRRMLAGGTALAVAGISSMGLVGPIGAQDGDVGLTIEELTAQLDPSTTTPGSDVTVTPSAPCPLLDGVPVDYQVLSWGVAEAGLFPGWDAFLDPSDPGVEVWELGEAPLDADGNWSVTFTAPEEPGRYEFIGFCGISEDVSIDDLDVDESLPVSESEEFETDEVDEVDEGDEVELTSIGGPQGVVVTATGGGHGPRGTKRCSWKNPGGGHETTTTTEAPPTTEEPEDTVPPSTEPEDTVPPTTAPEVPEEPEVPGDITVGVYGPLELTVAGGAAPPAVPVPAQPDFTG